MKKYFVIVFIFFGIFACDKASKVDQKIIAKVHDQVLTSYELSQLMPKRFAKKDSVKLAKYFIEQWALEQLLYKQALINLSDTRALDKMVQDYKEQLYIHQYKKELIQEHDDQQVLAKEIDDYYKEHQSRFKLSEPLIQFKYVHLKKNVKQVNQIKKILKSKSYENALDLVKNRALFYDFYLNDSTWVALQNVYAVQRDFPKLSNEVFETNRDLIEKKSEDGSVYLIKIQKYLKAGSLAPKVYVQTTIKEVLAQQNQLRFLNDIEKELLNEAIKEKKYERYK